MIHLLSEHLFRRSADISLFCGILFRYGQLLLQVVSETNNRWIFSPSERRGSTVPYWVCWHRSTWRRVSRSMYRAVTSHLAAKTPALTL